MAGGALQWWQLFQSQQYPAYVTLVHPKITGISLKKAQSRMSELALDDVLDTAADPDDWQPRTFVLKRGTVVLTLPEDADKEKSTFVSQPWMVRVNELWFFAQNPLTQEQEGPREPKTEAKTEADKRVIKWEQQQIRNARISAQHFQLECTYFYRLADLEQYNAFVSEENTVSKQQARNKKTMCQALLQLGVVESLAAAEELIKKRSTGSSRASRLLNRIVAFSTHEGKLPSTGAGKQQQQPGEDGEDSADDEQQEEDAAAAAAAAADGPTPMESVMSTCKVMFLPASEGLPYMPAPVAQAAQQRQTKTHKRGPLLVEVQQQHRELPPGFFCSLIYIKQTGELLNLEDWASGKAAPNLQQDWAQHSRQQAEELLQQTQRELDTLRQQRLAAAGADAAGALDDLADAAAAAAAGAAGAAAAAEEGDADAAADADADADAEDDAEYVSISEGESDAAAATASADIGQQPGTPTQEQLQQHSQQAAVLLHKQQQRATPRKSRTPLKAVLQQQQQQPQRRRRLRRAAAAAAAAAGASSDMDSDPVQIVSSDGSEPKSGAAACGGEAEEGQEHEEEEQVTPPVKRRRAAAAGLVSSSEEDAGSSCSDGSSEDEGSESGGSSDELTPRQAARGARKSGRRGRAKRGAGRSSAKASSSSEEQSDGSEEAFEVEEAAAEAAVAAKPRKRAAAGAAGGARAAKSRAKASAAAERGTRSALKTSKGAVLRSGR